MNSVEDQAHFAEGIQNQAHESERTLREAADELDDGVGLAGADQFSASTNR